MVLLVLTCLRPQGWLPNATRRPLRGPTPTPQHTTTMRTSSTDHHHLTLGKPTVAALEQWADVYQVVDKVLAERVGDGCSPCRPHSHGPRRSAASLDQHRGVAGRSQAHGALRPGLTWRRSASSVTWRADAEGSTLGLSRPRTHRQPGPGHSAIMLWSRWAGVLGTINLLDAAGRCT